MTTLTPETTLSIIDRGDDMQRRLRYQAGCAALYGLRILDDDSEFQELFCEHHEDVLLKRKDGCFIGVQVKTRAEGLEPFKATDETILRAVGRFVELELQFPTQFERFVLAANGGVWQRERNGNNLLYLLELAQSPSENGIDRQPLTKFINRVIKALFIAQFKQRFPLDKSELAAAVTSCLAKTYVEEEMPGLNDVEARLVKRLNAIAEFQGRRHDDLCRAIKTLTQTMFEAASLEAADTLAAYVTLAPNPASARVQTILDGKKLTKESIRACLITSLQADGLLRSNRAITVADLPKGMRRMELKMSAGGLSDNNIDLAKDLRSSTESLLLAWLYRYGEAEADVRYQHLRTLVRVECQEAYDQTATSESLFGEQLLQNIRLRLRERREREQGRLWECRHEHLMGMASLLTEECKLWWSKEFPLPEDTSL